jgi:hypothetical protein
MTLATDILPMPKNLLVGFAVLLAVAAPAAQAQKKLGAYVGTFDVSGSERDPVVTYKATVKVNLPVSERKAEAINVDLAGDGPPASIKVTQWDYFHREKSADSSGTFVETRCRLAAPVELPATVTGVANVDLRKKSYSMSLVLMSTKEMALSCSSTRQKSFRKSEGIALALGTGAPGMQADKPLPLSDPARLAAKFTMDASTQSQGALGPVVQEWDLKLTQ